MCCVVVPNLLWSCLQSVEMVISRSLHEHGDENYCFIGSWLSLLRGQGGGGWREGDSLSSPTLWVGPSDHPQTAAPHSSINQ